MIKQVLVTGANGFIGKHVVKKLFGYNVLPLISKTTNLEKIKKEIDNAKIDYVIHLGSLVDLDKSYEKAKKTIKDNIVGTLNILEAVKNKDLKRFVFFSTEEVYGNNKPPYSEEMHLDPTSPYSISKICGEHYCKMYNRLYDIPYTILRVSYVYGDGQKSERLIPYLFRQFMSNQNVELNADSQKRDFVYIDDLIDALQKVLTSTEAENEILNIGSSENYTAQDIAEFIKKITRTKGSIKFKEEEARKGESKEWSCDINKAKDILGWQPKLDIHEGLSKLHGIYKS